jgi:large subunit ribosomal protein L6
MSRIGKKPIAIPKGVTVKIEGNTVLVQGPKGKLDTALPAGIKVEQKDGNIVAIRENDSQAAVHGLARALVNNAVEGVTKGWTRDLEIVGIGYRAEMKGKLVVVFSLGYSHPIEYPLPTGVDAVVDPKQTKIAHGNRPPESRTGRRGNARAASARPIQEQRRALRRRAPEEEGRKDRSQIVVVSRRSFVVVRRVLMGCRRRKS